MTAEQGLNPKEIVITQTNGDPNALDFEFEASIPDVANQALCIIDIECFLTPEDILRTITTDETDPLFELNLVGQYFESGTKIEYECGSGLEFIGTGSGSMIFTCGNDGNWDLPTTLPICACKIDFLAIFYHLW